ncbi:Tautomerase/MIF superfamily, partial [Pholiota molesta]
MPILNLVTNVKIPDARAFVLEFSKAAAETLKKPEASFMINVIYNELLAPGGTFDPAFSLRIDSLDNLSAELNDGYSKALFAFFQEKLGIPGTRGFIVFVDPGRENIAHNGTTIAKILA